MNNYTTEDEKLLNELGSAESVRYLVYGREVGASGTPHLQGYVEWKNARGLPKEVLQKAHWEPRRGTPEQAATYCKKDGVFVEFGEVPKQGKRSDLIEVAERVRDGASLQEVAEESPGTVVRYHRGLEAIRLMRMKDRTEPPKVVWIWGETGTGKTREAAVGSFFMKDGTKWWDGYDQQDRIVIDDFDGTWPFRDLLRLLDRYPYQGQTKGGYVRINSCEIFITCEFHPNKFYIGTELKQVLRRITEVRHRSSDTEVDGNTSIN